MTYDRPHITRAVEYVDLGGAANTYIFATKLVPLKDERDIMMQVTSGMKFFHENGGVHRSLKPSSSKFQSCNVF